MNTKNKFLKLHDIANDLAKRKRRSILYYYADFLYFYYRTRGTLKHYHIGKIYDLRAFERRRVVSYKRWEKIVRVFNDKDNIAFFDNKVLFNKTFSKYIKRHWIYPANECSYDDFVAFATKHNEIISKPLNNWQGQGVEKRAVTPAFLSSENYKSLKDQNVLLEEVIRQHPKMCIGGNAVNTIRIFTLLNKDGSVNILSAVFRIGLGDAIIDNFCAGGMFFPLNIEHGYVDGEGLNHDYERTAFLPHSDRLMLGFQIPFWSEIIKMVKEAALQIPLCRFIGWDIAVGHDSPELIEGNHNPDYEFMELVGKHCDYYQIMNEK